MRILIAGLIGGLAMFCWGAVAHMLLPIGEAGHRTATHQQVVLDALAQSAAGEGVYMYPGMAPEQMGDAAAMQAFAQASRGKPYAFVVYQPGGNPVNQGMTPSLVTQWISDTLAALVVAWILALGAWSFGRRVLVAGSMGLFGVLAISVPQWSWYRFPLDFTLATLVMQVVGWTLAGAVIAWWLGRRRID